MLVLFTALLSALLTRLQIRFNSRLKLTAAPRTDRWHVTPTPSSGGLAIFLSCAAVYWLVCPGRYPALALGVAAMWVLGFIDDRLRLGAKTKFAAQVLAAAFVAMGGVSLPLTHHYALDVALNVFFIVFITNACNLIDNMDGLCAGVVIIICTFRFFLLSAQGYHADASLYAILAAAFGGFLFSNYHPARMFMGDCGSLPGGFALAALILIDPVSHKASPLVAFVSPALTCVYPLFDTTFVSTLRKLAGRPISQGGRDHSSHRLASLGLDQRQVVWILWLLTAFGASVADLTYLMPDAVVPAAAMLIGMVLMLGVSLARLPGYPLPEWARGWVSGRPGKQMSAAAGD
jgi:UDP-GlcNAc:undecaprenyl-phosphate/decaprenyl-phosphate GlcNAc-1-phosphate transferase